MAFEKQYQPKAETLKLCQKIINKVLLRDPIMEPELKSLFLENLISNVASYGLLGQDNNKLRAFVIKILRRSFSQNQDQFCDAGHLRYYLRTLFQLVVGAKNESALFGMAVELLNTLPSNFGRVFGEQVGEFH